MWKLIWFSKAIPNHAIICGLTTKKQDIHKRQTCKLGLRLYWEHVACFFVQANRRVEIIGVGDVCIFFHNLMTHFLGCTDTLFLEKYRCPMSDTDTGKTCRTPVSKWCLFFFSFFFASPTQRRHDMDQCFEYSSVPAGLKCEY